ncbi:hypothetical protein LOZ65_006815 [Ophidiomyces ophidiicola]|nr:hypothetical protein LOZ65_006815 [Ophidiomyces ophidiicola]
MAVVFLNDLIDIRVHSSSPSNIDIGGLRNEFGGFIHQLIQVTHSAEVRGDAHDRNDKDESIRNPKHSACDTGPPATSTSVLDQQSPLSPAEEEFHVNELITQIETQPITEEQLANEVRMIYAGLVLVERNNEQWQALLALHGTLLHEHHDFFLASQHPAAGPSLQKLAHRYAMPARMWRHGIHALLELLRDRLPDSLDHMLSFIHTSYSMMVVFLESVSNFEDTWIECLGDCICGSKAIFQGKE